LEIIGKYNKLNTKEFIRKSNLLHGNKYDYSNVNYNGIFEKVCVVCPIHGDFWQVPNIHINGCGCPKCGYIIRDKKNSFFIIKNILQK
jgi:hypothetical protein